MSAPTRLLDHVNPTVRGFAPGAVLLALSLAIAVSASTYWAYLGVTACQTVLLVLSAGLVFGQAGMLSLCPLSFAAVGAWMAGFFGVHAPHLWFPFIVVAAMAVAVPIGGVIGLLAIRLRGMHLAIATLAVAQVTTVLLSAFPIPGYSSGALVPRPSFARTQCGYFMACVVVTAVIAVVVSLVIKSRVGANWAMLREERATAGAGKSVFLGKVTVFCISAAIASAAGVILITQNGTVDVSSFSPQASLLVVVLALFLGGGTPEGALTGGVLGAFTPWLFNELSIANDLPNLFFAYGAVDVLSKFPGGISQHAQQRRRLARAARHRALTGGADEREAASAISSVARAAVEARRTGQASSARTDDLNGHHPAPSTSALEITQLTVRYGPFTALEDVSLSVPPMGLVGLIGPNGAGKTTLIDAASGFTSYAGSIKVAGQPLEGRPPHRRVHAGLRRTFQQSRVSESLTVRRYMHFVASAASQENVELALGLLDVPFPDRLLGEMDVPNRRLVEVAAAIAAAPDVLLLDEPAAGLGERESRILSERLVEVPRLFHTAVLLVEHDMDVVRSTCSTITVLDYGHVIASGPTTEVLDSSDVRRAYLGIEEEVTPL